MKKNLQLIAFVLLGIRLCAQNVGIGVAVPAYPLTVKAVNTGRGLAVINGDVEMGLFNNGTSAYVQTWSNHSLNFAVKDGSAKISISQTGLVGINTTSPAAQLDIDGTFRLRGSGAAEGKVLTSDASGNASWQATGSGKTMLANFSEEQPIPANTYTNVKFLNNVADAFNDFAAASFSNATSFFTVPAGQGGNYLLSAQVRWNTSSSIEGNTYYCTMSIFRNPPFFTIIESAGFSGTDLYKSAGILTPYISVNKVAKLNAGDVIGVRVYHNCQFPVSLVNPSSLYNHFSVTKL